MCYELGKVPRLVEEVLYPLTMPAGDVVVHGLVELLALDDAGSLLALERTWGPEVGMILNLFEIRWAETAVDVDRSRLSPAARRLRVLVKRRILDFAKLPILLGNFEGLTFGPPLPDGGESLLVVGDNNNTECAPPAQGHLQDLAQLQPTRLLLFMLRR